MLLGEQCCLTVGLCKAVRTERDGFHGTNIVSLDQKKLSSWIIGLGSSSSMMLDAWKFFLWIVYQI